MRVPEERILPPFPDALVSPNRKEDVIRWLLAHDIPGRYAANHLQRWGQVTGVEITPAEFGRVRGSLPAREE
jgi:hypothetical protein